MTSSNRTRLIEELVMRHGEILKGEALRKSLGYRSKRSLYRAIAAGEVPVPIFKLRGQLAWSAKTRDVAEWLSSLGSENTCETTVDLEATKAAK